MSECAQCTDYLDTVDFEGNLICPICHAHATNKRDAAVKLLLDMADIYCMSPEDMSRIKSIVNLRDY